MRNPFLDPEGYTAWVDAAEKAFRDEVEKQRKAAAAAGVEMLDVGHAASPSRARSFVETARHLASEAEILHILIKRRSMLAQFLEDIREGDMIAPKRMAERLRVPMAQMARLAHVSRNTLTGKADSPVVQKRLGEIARIIGKAAELSGDEGRAIIWFRHQPIPGFGDKTAEELVEAGHAEAVLWHLRGMEEGAYA
jgi:uncharacterized protein (DUF2384 family)